MKLETEAEKKQVFYFYSFAFRTIQSFIELRVDHFTSISNEK